jgi:hypothetical protein
VAGELQYLVIDIYLLDNVSSGAQTVENTGSTSYDKVSQCYTVTSTGAVEFIDSDTFESTSDSTTTGTLSLTNKDCFAIMGGASGEDAVGSVAPNSGWTQDYEFDNGETVTFFYRYSTIQSSNITNVGVTQTSDDILWAAAAFADSIVTHTGSVTYSVELDESETNKGVFDKSLTLDVDLTKTFIKQLVTEKSISFSNNLDFLLAVGKDISGSLTFLKNLNINISNQLTSKTNTASYYNFIIYFRYS